MEYLEDCSTTMRRVARRWPPWKAGLYGSEVVSLWGCYFQTGGLVYDRMEDKRYIHAVDVDQVRITIGQKAMYLIQNMYYISNFNSNLLLVFYLVNYKYHVCFLS